LGREVIYTADSFALSMLEMLVKLGRAAPPTNYVYGALRISEVSRPVGEKSKRPVGGVDLIVRPAGRFSCG
jgi:hypothetical protein